MKKFLEAKDVEEIKPGIFLQKTIKGYRVINPLVYKGKWNFKNQIKIRNILMVLIVLFVAYSYVQETKYCSEWSADPCSRLENLTEYCSIQYGKTGDTLSIPISVEDTLGTFRYGNNEERLG